MKHTIFIILALLCHHMIRGQDLIQRVKQDNFVKNQIITSEHSALAQKFMHTRKEELAVVSLFTSKSIDSQKRTAIDQSVSDAIVLDFNLKDLITFISTKNAHPQFLLRIPVDDTRSFDLLLEESAALSETFVLLTSDGDQMDYEAPGAFYNGIINGIPESFATVSITQDGVEILASDPFGNYLITEIKGSENEYILFNDYKRINKTPFTCSTNIDEFVMPDFIDPNVIEKDKQLKVRDNVEVYFEVDYSIYSGLGFSMNQTMDYVLDVFRATVSVYEFEQISLRLNKVLIWTSDNDPVTTTDDIDAWGCIGFTDADIAHYISFTGNNAGIANGIGSLCDLRDAGICGNDDTSHCISAGLLSSFVEIDEGLSTTLGYTVMSDDLSLICHEMGHVFGSPHTHGCYWNGNDTQIDDCGNIGATNPEGSGCYNPASPIVPPTGGTIMSYCNFNPVSINFSVGFGSQPGNLIRSTINNSSCIDVYEIACPEVETLENTITSNTTYDAKKEVLIHDSSVANGFDPTFTGGERTIIYGNFQCAVGAGFDITLTGCN